MREKKEAATRGLFPLLPPLRCATRRLLPPLLTGTGRGRTGRTPSHHPRAVGAGVGAYVKHLFLA